MSCQVPVAWVIVQRKDMLPETTDSSFRTSKQIVTFQAHPIFNDGTSTVVRKHVICENGCFSEIDNIYIVPAFGGDE